MRRSSVSRVLSLAVVLMMFTGCSMFHGSDVSERYKELQRFSAGFEESSNTGSVPPVLTNNSTLPDYLAYAALHNPGLEAAFNRWKAALEKIPQVRSLPDPRFTYSYYIENVETRVGPQRHAFNLTQTFPWFGKLELLGDVALQETNMLKQAYDTKKLNLFYQVKETYYEYYYLSRTITVTEENMKLLSYFESVARTKYSAGGLTIADVIKAQVELGKLEERLLSLTSLKEPVIARLNAALNRPSDAPLPQPEALPEENITCSDEDVIKQIEKHNPELKSLEYKAEKETKAIELAKKLFYPDITFGISYIETGSSVMPGAVDSGKDPVISMLSINLPIWRSKYSAGVRAAETRYKSVKKEHENRNNSLVAEAKTTLYNYHDSNRKVELYRDTLIPKARQSLNVTQTAFEAGKKDFLSLIDSQRTLLELELAYERALTNRAKYYAQAEKLIGIRITEIDL